MELCSSVPSGWCLAFIRPPMCTRELILVFPPHFSESPACPATLAALAFHESVDLSGILCLIPNLSRLVKFDGA